MRLQRALSKRPRCRCGCSELGAVVLQGSVHNGDSPGFSRSWRHKVSGKHQMALKPRAAAQPPQLVLTPASRMVRR